MPRTMHNFFFSKIISIQTSIQGIDKLAHIRNVETLYLHVDVTNDAAIALYNNAGYRKVPPNEIHHAFTKSLNLHDGASSGRKHFLLYKHLRTPTFLSHKMNKNNIETTKNSIGFEIPF